MRVVSSLSVLEGIKPRDLCWSDSDVSCLPRPPDPLFEDHTYNMTSVQAKTEYFGFRISFAV